MTGTSETKSRFARRLSENNKRVWVCIDCLKPRSNKNKFEFKNVVALNFMYSIIKILHLKYCAFVMYKMAILSKIKPHSDAVDYF